ncbi:ABC transporter ATP-binding protein [Paenibacillus piri]|uniref:ABC transporter ATP-binding protein n=1 Tax=Paenibacillus piri TaxID=2547395 RepID=A0A4V2ZT93_9BACL|nr:ABC transporter ATP-binding protein [Paenibacillus piri]TDF96204.1 ABC transporter ATP-binding protein [Paenibacillus piri]
MSSNFAITINNLSKCFQIFDRPQDRLKQGIFRGRKKFFREFWALHNVSFDIKKGETIGIIGRNGSGKSTLLQIIAGTLSKTSGEVRVNGRVSALLELGSGFNPEFTGRENVIMSAAIMGISTKEILEKMPLIEQFAEIGEFIDQPVKSYSSGMFLRLAFACAVNVDPDILIIDEALAVGDMQFQLKCIERMKLFKSQGKTILFVSHDTYSMRNFCDQAIWMMDGHIHLRGDVNSVTNAYQDFMKFGNDSNVTLEHKEEKTERILSINDVTFLDIDGKIKKNFSYGEDITVEVNFTILSTMEGIVGGIALYDKQNTYVCGLNTKLDEYPLPSEPGEYKLILSYNNFDLLPGTYFVDVGFYESSAVVNLDYKSRYKYFMVHSGEYFAEGLTYIDHQWSVGGG